MAQHIGGMLKKALKSTLSSQVGYVLARSAFKEFRKKIDYSEYGGAPLLGVRGITRHRPRPLERERHQECDSRGGGTVPLEGQRKDRAGTFRDCRAGAGLEAAREPVQWHSAERIR